MDTSDKIRERDVNCLLFSLKLALETYVFIESTYTCHYSVVVQLVILLRLSLDRADFKRSVHVQLV